MGTNEGILKSIDSCLKHFSIKPGLGVGLRMYFVPIYDDNKGYCFYGSLDIKTYDHDTYCFFPDSLIKKLGIDDSMWAEILKIDLKQNHSDR